MAMMARSSFALVRNSVCLFVLGSAAAGGVDAQTAKSSPGAEAANIVAPLPEGFVYLRDVAPDIVQDIRYASSRNFLGRPVAGYLAAECILTSETAHALAHVQKALPAEYSLIVYDCYRPRMAVADFMTWLANARDQSEKAFYYPTVTKSRLVALGYLSPRSAHSRGSAVDVALVLRTGSVDSKTLSPPPACHEPGGATRDGGVDFGTAYDCFHETSATRHPGVTATAKHNRSLLVAEMRRAGFTNYHREWWHFELSDEPFDRAFNFPVRQKDVTSEPIVAEEFGSAGLCGTSEPLKLTCSAEWGSVVAYAEPSKTSSRVTEFLGPEDRYICLRCTGDTPLSVYASLDELGQLTRFPPWCLVSRRARESPTEVIGWVRGDRLAPEGRPDRGCAVRASRPR